MSVTHPDWCLGTEAEGEAHESGVVHAARPTDIADIRLCLVQLEDVVSVKVELMEDDVTNLYILPLEQAQALVASAAGLLARVGRGMEVGAAPAG